MKRYPVIVTVGTPDRCVVFGWAAQPVKPGERPKLSRARMVLYWSADCSGLFGMEARGPTKNCRITPAVLSTCPGEVVRVIEVSPLAAEAFDA